MPAQRVTVRIPSNLSRRLRVFAQLGGNLNPRPSARRWSFTCGKSKEVFRPTMLSGLRA